MTSVLSRRSTLKPGAGAVGAAPSDTESVSGYLFLAPSGPGPVRSAQIAIALHGDGSASMTICRGQNSAPCEPILLPADAVAELLHAVFSDSL
jgi:hypothetical protein